MINWHRALRRVLYPSSIDYVMRNARPMFEYDTQLITPI